MDQFNKRESVIEKRCVKLAKARGWFEVKVERCNKNGMPDRIFIKGGRVIFVEFKNDAGRLSQIQETRIDELKNHGAIVYVVRSDIAMGAILDANEL